MSLSTPAYPPLSCTNSAFPQVLVDINRGHDGVKNQLAFRLSNLQLSRNFVSRGDLKGALAAVRRCGDPSVGADLVQVRQDMGYVRVEVVAVCGGGGGGSREVGVCVSRQDKT